MTTADQAPDLRRREAVQPAGKTPPTSHHARTQRPWDHDTSVFAVATIEKWWDQLGRHKYPNATQLLITADGGGSNGHRPWQWKFELARLSTATGLAITVAHYPPGTSKWNKVEHRLFSRITLNWRGRPLTTYQTVVNLISHTTTRTASSCNANSTRISTP